MADRYFRSKALGTFVPDFKAEGLESKTFWSRIVLDEKQFNTQEHNHSFYELHYCLGGSGEIDVDGVQLRLKSGSFVLVKAMQNHRIVSQSANFVKFVWGFKINYQSDQDASKFEAILSSANGVYTASELMHRSFENLLLSAENMQNNRLYSASASLACIFFEMCATFPDESVDFCNSKVKYKDKNERQIKEIKTFIKDNVCKGITVADVSVEFSTGERQLSRIFHKYQSISLAEYLKEERFLAAQRLMIDEEYTLDQIASLVGYADAFTFGKAFKKRFGISPGAFRKTAAKK